VEGGQGEEGVEDKLRELASFVESSASATAPLRERGQRGRSSLPYRGALSR